MFMQMVFLNINTWILYDNESVLIIVYLYEIQNWDCETRFTSYRIWVASSVPPLSYNSKRHIFYFPFRTNTTAFILSQIPSPRSVLISVPLLQSPSCFIQRQAREHLLAHSVPSSVQVGSYCYLGLRAATPFFTVVFSCWKVFSSKGLLSRFSSEGENKWCMWKIFASSRYPCVDRLINRI